MPTLKLPAQLPDQLPSIICTGFSVPIQRIYIKYWCSITFDIVWTRNVLATALDTADFLTRCVTWLGRQVMNQLVHPEVRSEMLSVTANK